MTLLKILKKQTLGILIDKVIGDPNQPTTIIGTLIKGEDKAAAYPIPKEMTKGQAKPGIVTTKTIEDGDVTTTVTTTMVPIQDLPKDYNFSTGDVSEGIFPGFEEMPVDDTKTMYYCN